jgi:hypothetical protein
VGQSTDPSILALSLALSTLVNADERSSEATPFDSESGDGTYPLRYFFWRLMTFTQAGSKSQPAFLPDFGTTSIPPAILWLDEPDYHELLKRAPPGTIHPSWRIYCIWIEECIALRKQIGSPLKVYRGTALGVVAYIYRAKRELNTAALTACAQEQMERDVRPMNCA